MQKVKGVYAGEIRLLWTPKANLIPTKLFQCEQPGAASNAAPECVEQSWQATLEKEIISPN